MNKYLLFWFFLTLTAEMLMFYFVKKAKYDKQNLIISIVLYGCIPFFLYKMLQYDDEIGILNVIWNILSTIYGLLIGILIFNERISNLQCWGALLGLLSIVMILHDDPNF